MDKSAKRLPQVLLAIFVLLAATAVSRFLGYWAGAICYINRDVVPGLDDVGRTVGGAAGCLAAILWLLAMWRIMRKPDARPILAGSLLGMAAGLLASLILHASLIASGSPYSVVGNLVEAALWGLPAGLITGLVCGLAAWGTAKWSRRHE